jgi:hypothetical protein
MIPKRMHGPVLIYLKQRLKMVRAPPAGSQRQKADQRSTLGPGYGESGPITNRSSHVSRARKHILALVVQAVAHALRSSTMVTLAPGRLQPFSCTSDAEMIEGVVGALDPHEFVFARLMTLADALGCTWACAFFSLLSVPLSIRS